MNQTTPTYRKPTYETYNGTPMVDLYMKEKYKL